MAEQRSRTQSESIQPGRSREGEKGGSMAQYRDPVDWFDWMFNRMQRDFFGTSLFGPWLPERGQQREGGIQRMAHLQMRDTGDAIAVTAELPGIDQKDVQIEFRDGMLTIRGESQHEEDGRQTSVSFYRQVLLPEDVDADNAKASCSNGVVTVRFPRREQRSNVKQIPVSTEREAAKEKAA
jgi:HSP20 family molecular chaperone IbpA